MGIHAKILEVQKAVRYIEKNGKNTFHKYDYATEADVLEVKRIMNDHGLIAYPSLVGYQTHTRVTEGKNGREEHVQVFQEIEYTVADAETGETVVSRVLGSGEDKGDKGTYKGTTGANKYFYLKFFGVATGDDPENDEAEVKPRQDLKPAPLKEYSKPQPVPDPEISPEAQAKFTEIGGIIASGIVAPQEVLGFGYGTATDAKNKNDVKTLNLILGKLTILKQERTANAGNQ